MKRETILEISNALFNALEKRSPIEPISNSYPDITLEDSYCIQDEFVQLKVSKNNVKVIGKKIGLTNRAIQKQIGVYEPDFSIITSDGVFYSGGELAIDNYIAPRLEAEIAFILSKDITMDMFPVNSADVLLATKGVMPSLEIVDSRIIDWKIKIQDTVCDMASYAGIVLGNKIIDLNKLDLRCLGMSAYRNGDLVQHGTSANVMGNPINSVVWLVNKQLSIGKEFKKGEIILSGSFTPVFKIEKGDFINVIFDHLGEVTLRIV